MSQIIGRNQVIRTVLCRKNVKQNVMQLSAFSSSHEYDKYCLNIVKNNDYDHYLIGLLLPKKQQPAYFALRTFNVEIATVKDHTRGNIAASRLRFQYWRNVFDFIFNESTSSSPKVNPNDLQPVARALQHHYAYKKWSYNMFQRYLEGRFQHYHGGEMQTLNDMEEIAENTQSSLLYLSLEISGIDNPSVDQMASHVGVSAGITTLIRALSSPHSQEFDSFPRDIRHKYSLTSNILIGRIANADEKKKLQDAIYDIACQAAGHLDRARELNEKCLQKGIYAYPVSLEAVLIALYLEELRRVDFDIFSPELDSEKMRFKQICQLLKTRWRGRF